ncbi:SDR family NAD(P)-dependent oxidoreductase [Chelativorans sp.]|uniref:SDR family NAD(P)-dependent oxidoreductase n=1 Tax=Chelativorans sp. TaxID=2203393 RepID=UPI002810F69A|nr:SDR family NAD(P)-dependent oxidoreductase [Chelativorans sp.]
MDFSGKTVLITGGAGAIGSATARLFLRHGASVVLADLNEEALLTLERDIAAPDRLAVVPGDAADPETAERAVRTAVERFGALDVLFNNAGISGKVAPVHELDLDAWDAIVRANLRSMFCMLKASAAEMVRAGRGGAIVNMGSSMAGWDVLLGGAGYVSTKHAVVGLTKAAALDLAPHGIRVNAVCPGVIETTLGVPGLRDGAAEDRSAVQHFAERIPSRRIGQVEDVAEVVLFLASDGARHVNGAAWLIDGGQTLQSFANGPLSGGY